MHSPCFSQAAAVGPIVIARALPKRLAAAAVLLIAVSLSTTALGGDGPGAAPSGAELLKPFKQQLMGALQAGLAEGPEQAIAACRLQAPEIAASLSSGGVRMGRTSHRLRNPANTGPDWAQAVLRDYLETDGWPSPLTVDLADGRQGYAEPIKVQALCLTCHGENLAPAVTSAIAKHYPHDQATGFREGDLRGVFWVEYAND